MSTHTVTMWRCGAARGEGVFVTNVLEGDEGRVGHVSIDGVHGVGVAADVRVVGLQVHGLWGANVVTNIT